MIQIPAVATAAPPNTAAPPAVATVYAAPVAAKDWIVANNDPATTFPIVAWVAAAIDPATTPPAPKPNIRGVTATVNTVPPTAPNAMPDINNILLIFFLIEFKELLFSNEEPLLSADDEPALPDWLDEAPPLSDPDPDALLLADEEPLLSADDEPALSDFIDEYLFLFDLFSEFWLINFPIYFPDLFYASFTFIPAFVIASCVFFNIYLLPFLKLSSAPF